MIEIFAKGEVFIDSVPVEKSPELPKRTGDLIKEKTALSNLFFLRFSIIT